MTIRTHIGDLPNLDHYTGDVAIDTEAMGLKPHRDRLCVVQLSPGDGSADIVQIVRGQKSAPHIQTLLGDPGRTKIFHYARFDLALLTHSFKTEINSVFCTKIASRLCRTYTDRHGLKDVTRELLDVELSKQQQSSDWGAKQLSDEQKRYAASDVLYLHQLRNILQDRLIREDRLSVAQACFDFVPHRATLDLLGWGDSDIFSHS